MCIDIRYVDLDIIAYLRDFNSGPFVFRSDVLAVDPLMESINSSAGVDSFRLGPSLLSAAWSHEHKMHIRECTTCHGVN